LNHKVNLFYLYAHTLIQTTLYSFLLNILIDILPFQVDIFKQCIPIAFQYAKDIILDCEVLMYDQTTNKPLPFGTLGIHKVYILFK